MAFFANEARFSYIYVFFGACPLQNEVGDPLYNCFTFVTSLTRQLSMVKFSEKNQC